MSKVHVLSAITLAKFVLLALLLSNEARSSAEATTPGAVLRARSLEITGKPGKVAGIDQRHSGRSRVPIRRVGFRTFT